MENKFNAARDPFWTFFDDEGGPQLNSDHAGLLPFDLCGSIDCVRHMPAGIGRHRA